MVDVTALGNHTVLDTLAASFGGRAVQQAGSPSRRQEDGGPELIKTHRTQGVGTAGYRTLYPESIALIASLVVEESRIITPPA